MSTSKVPLDQVAYTNIDRQRVLRTLKPGVHDNEPLRRNSLKSGRILNDVQHRPRSGSRSNIPVLPSLRSGSTAQNNKRRPSDAAKLLQDTNLPSTLHYRGSDGASPHYPHISSLYFNRAQPAFSAAGQGDTPFANTISITSQSTPRTTGLSLLRRISDGCPAGMSNSPRIIDPQKTPIQQPSTPVGFALPGPRYSRSRATSGSSSGSSTYVRKYKYNPPNAGDQHISPGSSDSASVTVTTTTNARASPLASLVSGAAASNEQSNLQNMKTDSCVSAPKDKEKIKRSSTAISKRCVYGKPLVTIDDVCEVDRMFRKLEASCAAQSIPPVVETVDDAANIPAKVLSTVDSRSSIDPVRALRVNLADSSDDTSDDNGPSSALTRNPRSKSCINASRKSEHLTIFLGTRKG